MSEKTFKYALIATAVLGFVSFLCLVGVFASGLADRVFQSEVPKAQLPLAPSPTATERPTLPPTWTPIPTVPPTDTPTPFATWTSMPTRTPTSAVTTFEPGDGAGFRAYLRSQYGSIAGQKLGIEDVLVYDKDGDCMILITLTRGSGLRVFEKQTQAIALDYGRRLLRDAIRYFNGQWCATFVGTSFYTSDLWLYYGDEWYDVGDYDEHEGGWPVDQDYVRAYFTGGEERVEVWNR